MRIVFHVGYSSTHWNPTTPALGGTEQCVSNLALELARKGHEVYVYGEVLEHHQVEHEGSVRYLPLASKGMIPKTIDVLVGVAYLHYLKFFQGHTVRKKVFWLHNEEAYPWYQGEAMSANEMSQAYGQTDEIVCLTDWHKSNFLLNHPYMCGRVSVIRNGIDPSKIAPAATKQPNSYIYSSHAERGLEKVLDELPENAHLHIATPKYGEEYLKEHFLPRIEEMKNVTYHGPLSVEKLYKLMAKCETWYYPTDYNETFCITAIEMLAHYVKPQVNPIAGLKETISEFNNVEHMDWGRARGYVTSHWWGLVADDWEKLFGIEPDAEMTYIITLNPTAEKEKEIRERFEASGFDSPWQVFEATNGHTGELMPYGYEVKKDWKIPGHKNDWWSRDVLPGEIGCALSHYRVWLDAFRNGYKRILILEEDFKVERPFDCRWELNTDFDWTLMYMGHTFVNPPKRDVTDYLVEPDYTYCTHAYMLTHEGCRLLLEHNFHRMIFPVDEFLSATFCNHPREDLNFITKDTRALAVKAPFFSQTSNKNNSTTEMKQERMCDMSYPDFVKKYVTYSAQQKEFDLTVEEPINDVFVFPLFKPEFGEKLIQEAEENGDWTKQRHDYYPTTDMLITELGLQKYYQYVLQDFVYPAAIHKWNLEGKEWTNMVSENFIVKYDENDQGHLSLHHDSASITAVLALNDGYEGGGTWFSRQQKLHKGKPGFVSLHPGVITHRHGGRPVSKGQRYILVSFCNRVKQ